MAGHDPNYMLQEYSFEQLGLFGRCILTHQSKMMNMLLSPMLGEEFKPGTVPRPKSDKPMTDKEAEAKDRKMLRSLGASPFGVRTVKTSSDGNAP